MKLPDLNVFLFIIMSFISTTIYYCCYRLLTNKELKTNLKTFLTIIIAGFAFYVNDTYSSTFLGVIISYIIFVALFKIGFNDKLRKCMMITLEIWILGMLMETVFSLILATTGIITETTAGMTLLTIKLLGSLIISTGVFIVLKIKYINKKLLLFNNFCDLTKIDYLATIIMMFLLGILGTYNFLEINNSSSNIFVIILVLLFLLLTIYLIRLLNEESILELKNKNLQQTNKLYNSIVDDYKELKHNIINHLLTIRSVSNKEAQKLIDDRISTYKLNHDFISQLELAPNGIKDLLYIKLSNAKKLLKNISIDNKTNVDLIKVLNPKVYNSLLEAIGIVVDNAIDATIETDYKGIHFDFESSIIEYKVRIVNTFTSNIDVNKLGTLKYTTKKKGHGIGLHSLRKNKNITVKYEIVNNKFCTIISVPLKKELNN